MDIILNLSQGNIIAVALTVIASSAALFIYYNSKNKHNFWIERGIKGPKPLPVFGNLLSLLRGNRMKKELEWVKKYGKVYGIYHGTTPHLVVADPETLIQICVKDFEVFPNHSAQEFAHRYFRYSLFSTRDNHWKRSRALMSPTFTSGKMRRMFRFLDGCANDLVQCFNDQLKRSGEEKAVVDIKDQFNLYTMDAIAACCYGLKLEPPGVEVSTNSASKEDFVKEAGKIFKFNLLRLTMALTFPKTLLRFFKYQLTSDDDIEPLAARLRQLIDQRRNSSKKFDDYLQLLIDAKLQDKLELDEMDSAENHHVAQTIDSLMEEQKRIVNDVERESGSSKASLTDFEILSNAVILMVVGLETTSTILTHCIYTLAFHQEIQEKLYGELMKIAQFDELTRKFKFEFESVTSCKYLDAVLSEALRLLTPILQSDRNSIRPYYLKKYNLALPENIIVQLALYAVQNDPEIWPEPERFKPERFLSGDNVVPGSYCPFGLGPRHCLGMRFSLTESKMALAKLLANFRFDPAPNTKFPPEPKRLFGLNNIKTPIVNVVSRI